MKKHLRRRQVRPSLQKLREFLFGSPPSAHPGLSMRRNSGIRIESLEGRLLLAGDLGVDDLLPADGSQAVVEGPASLDVQATDSAANPAAEGENVPAQDLVAFAKALAQAGTVEYGAIWCPACNAQKELFEDGGEFMPFVEVTNPDRTLNQIGIDNNITAFPTWVFPDGTREVGVIPLQTLADRSGIAIPTSADPFVAPTGDVTVLGGSPLHVGLNGYDPNGGPLTYTVTSSNPDVVTPTVLSGNRSATVRVAGWGNMTFQLFEQRAPRAAGRFIELAESGFYDASNQDPDIGMHRIIDSFIMQFGDPTGTGAGGSTLGDFDDQFHPDLQHNNPGGISWAKAGDDTNDSQVFVIDVPTRFLDFNHSYFGQLTDGEKIRDGITGVATDASDRPLVPINIESVTIGNDIENGVLMLKAAEGATGEADVTVTVTDEDGNQFSDVFHVTVTPDTVNGGPFLNDIPTIQTTVNTPAVFQLSSVDVEGDAVLYDGLNVGNVNYTVSVDSQTGQATVTPPTDFIGSFDVQVRVRPATSSDTNDLFDSQLATIVVAPTAPANVDLLAVSDSGFADDDELTNITSGMQLDISGVTDGALVRLHQGDTILGQATAGGSIAHITTSALSGLGDGTFSLFATQIVDNVESPPSPTLDVTIDTTAPADFTSTGPSVATVGQPLTYNAENPDEGLSGAVYSLVNAPGNASIDAAAGLLTWTPTGSEIGTQAFGVVLADAAGNTRTQNLSVDVQNSALVALRVEVADLSGTPISSIDVGGDFQLRIFTEDLRSVNADGVFAAYLDVLYDSQLVSVNGTISYGSEYPTAQSGDTSTAGLIDEIGAVAGFTPLGTGEFLLASLPMQATHAGQVTFVGDPADVAESIENSGHDTLVFGSNSPVLAEDISYGSTTLTVNVAFNPNDDLFNVDEDSGATTVDPLANDTVDPGSPGNLVIVDTGQTSHGGTVQIAADGKSVAYTPPADFFGEDTFSYSASDGTGTAQAIVTIQVAPINDPPVAVDDSLTVVEDSVNSLLDVLGNDLITPDAGESLQVTSVGTPSQGGTVTVLADGSGVQYTPAHNFFGSETFSYTISDGNGGSATATATVDVTEFNDPPVARDDLVNVDEDSIDNSVDVLSNDDTAGDQGESLTITAVDTPENGGTVTIAADQLSLIYSPAADFFGTERFIYTISDGNGGTAQATVTMVVAGLNDPPTATDDALSVVKDSADNSLDLLANDSAAPDANETLVVSQVGTTSAGGTVNLSPEGAVTYTPPAGFTGDDVFTYTISDPGGATATATATVTVLDFVPSNLSGFAYVDVDNDGVRDETEAPLGGIIISLVSNDALEGPVELQQTTDAHGFYEFRDLAPGTYTATANQPQFLIDGIDDGAGQGTAVGENGIEINLQQDANLTEVNFAERGRKSPHISLFDFFTTTSRDSVLTAVNPSDGSQWYAIEGGWNSAKTVQLQVSADSNTAGLDVMDDQSMEHNATIDLNSPRLIHQVGQEQTDLLYRIVASPHVLFPNDDCACAPDAGSPAEGEAASAAPDSGAPETPLGATRAMGLGSLDSVLDLTPINGAEGESSTVSTPAHHPLATDEIMLQVGEAPDQQPELATFGDWLSDNESQFADSVDQLLEPDGSDTDLGFLL